MSKCKGLLAVVLSVFIATPLASQEKAVVFEVLGGGYNHTRNLNTAGQDAHFKTGYVLGAGVGININKYIGIMGDASLARTEGSGAVTFANKVVNRYFAGGHVELRYPVHELTPFIYGGGGAVHVDQQGKEVDENFQHFTRGAGIFGAGLMFDVPNSPIDLVAEGRATTFKWIASPFSRVQWDVAYTIGLSYRLGL